LEQWTGMLQPVSNRLQSCMPAMGLHLVARRRKRTERDKRACWLFLVFVSTLPTSAQDVSPPLAQLRVELDHLRAEAPHHEETRGASPRLTAIKHHMRDWVESQLGQVSSDPNGDGGAELTLAGRLNAELKRAHMVRDTEDTGTDDRSSTIGFLGPVRLEYRQRQDYLVLQTAVEIYCGFDESAYLYRWQDGRWKRIWESEQNTYTKEKYAPQLIRAVSVSPSYNGALPYILTLGTEPWCSSNWHDVYVRIWSTGASGREPKLLLDKSEWAFLGAHDIPVQGSIGRNDALIEYTVGSVDSGVLNREAVLHYSLTPDSAKRIDPIALGPRDFVDEWLSEPWEQSRVRAQPSERAALEKAHQDTGRDEFQPTRSCRVPDMWQVGLGSIEGKKAPVYYLVRWRPPYRFTMIRVSQRPSPDCTEIDPSADGENRTLFPVQDWRE